MLVITSIAICFMTNAVLLLLFGVLIGIASAFIMTAQMPFAIEWSPSRHTAMIAACHRPSTRPQLCSAA